MKRSTLLAAADKRALSLVMDLMALRGGSGDEGEVARYVREALLAAGAEVGAVREDGAQRRIPLGGTTGNLIFSLPGRGARRMLAAHLDTVPICVGARPVRRGNVIAAANANTGLGGDDRAGVAVVLAAALHLLETRPEHPPVTFVWFVQEEVGLYGARYVDLKLLGKPQLAFNFDGGKANKLTIGATGGYRMTIRVTGLASHAGGAPEEGISAIAIAALAIADLQRNGWHGLIRKTGRNGRVREGTSNVGVIQGGTATNVVTDRVDLRVEARSHDPTFRRRIIREIEQAFRRAAKEVRNKTGQRGEVAIEGNLDYESFRLSPSEPAVKVAQGAVAAVGLTPELAISNGGLDANWLTAHGIPTVTLGCGQMNIHTTSEQLDVEQFLLACRIGAKLAEGGRE